MNVVDGERLKSFLEKRECDKIVVSKMLQECLKFDNNYAIKHHFASRNDFFAKNFVLPINVNQKK